MYLYVNSIRQKLIVVFLCLILDIFHIEYPVIVLAHDNSVCVYKSWNAHMQIYNI